MLSIIREIKVADLFSILNLAFGFLSIVMKEPNFILISALMDGFDGYFARRGYSGKFGKELDTLADITSFGIAPAYFIGVYGIPFLIGGFLRLARFSKIDAEYFIGYPITPSALIVISLVKLGLFNYAIVSSFLLTFFMIYDVRYEKIRDNAFLGISAIVIALAIILSPFSYILIAICTAYLLSPCLAIGKHSVNQ